MAEFKFSLSWSLCFREQPPVIVLSSMLIENTIFLTNRDLEKYCTKMRMHSGRIVNKLTLILTLWLTTMSVYISLQLGCVLFRPTSGDPRKHITFWGYFSQGISKLPNILYIPKSDSAFSFHSVKYTQRWSYILDFLERRFLLQSLWERKPSILSYYLLGLHYFKHFSGGLLEKAV